VVARTILLSILAASLAAPAAAEARRPSLALVTSDPITVAGAHFARAAA
jgi:hypothetical protein